MSDKTYREDGLYQDILELIVSELTTLHPDATFRFGFAEGYDESNGEREFLLTTPSGEDMTTFEFNYNSRTRALMEAADTLCIVE